MKVAVMVAGVVAFLLAVAYLGAMARIALLLQRDGRVKGVGIDGANAQLKLFRVVFFNQDLDENFAASHARLLATARWSGGAGFVVVIALFAGILLGFAG